MRVLAVVTAVLLTAPAGFAQTQTSPVPAAPPGTPSAVPGAPPALPPRDPAVRTGTAALRGRVFAGDTGQPLRKAHVRIVASAPGGAQLALGPPENRTTSTDAQGRYEFKELPPGRYTLLASKGSYVQLAYGQRRANEPGRPLEVLDGQTIEKVDFSLPRGGVVTGRILDEFGDPASDVQVQMLRSQMIAGRRQLVPSGRSSITNDIGEFRIFALAPGQYAVRENGVDVTDSGFEVRPNEDLAGFEVELTTRLTEVAGLVTNSRGESATDYTAVVFAQDRWRGNGRYIRVSRSDQDGRFKVSGLPSGQYYAIALDDVDPNNVTDPDFLDTVSARATRFSLADGETKALNLKLVQGQ